MAVSRGISHGGVSSPGLGLPSAVCLCLFLNWSVSSCFASEGATAVGGKGGRARDKPDQTGEQV